MTSAPPRIAASTSAPLLGCSAFYRYCDREVQEMARISNSPCMGLIRRSESAIIKSTEILYGKRKDRRRRLTGFQFEANGVFLRRRRGHSVFPSLPALSIRMFKTYRNRLGLYPLERTRALADESLSCSGL